MKRKRDTKSTNGLLILGLFFTIFLITLGISYSFTRDYILRQAPVSIREESTVYSQTLSLEDLNSLYLDSQEPDTVPILAYHQVREILATDTRDARLFITTPATFEQEMRYLREHGYTSITPTQYINYLRDKVRNPIPSRSVVITLDDGYRTQYENAYTILEKYKLMATFFIYGSCVDEYPVCLTSAEISEMTNHGMRLGNHTLDHLYLTQVKDRIIKREIKDNQEYLVHNWGNSVESVVAYPYGLVDERVINIEQQLGIIGGLGVSFYAKDAKNIYNLPRYLLGDNFQSFLNIFEKQE